MANNPVTSLNVLAMLVAQNEGRKTQVNIAQIKEILKVVGVLCVERPEVIALLIKHGAKK